MDARQFPENKISRPHTEINFDTSGIGGSSSSSDKILMLAGSAKGGAPDTVYRVRNFQEAQRVFRSGDLLDAIELAWNPNMEGTSAGDILALRVEDSENAELEKGGLTFESKLYGNEANDIQVSLTDNDLTDTKRLQVVFPKERYSKTFDNLGKIFSIEYTGSEAQAAFSVEENKDTKRVERLVLKTGSSSGDGEGNLKEETSFKLGEGVYEDANVLIAEINNLPDWKATFFPIGDKNVQTSTFEPVEDKDAKQEESYVEALGGDIQKQLAYNEYVTITVDTSKDIANFSLSNLEGGTDGVAPTSWADKFKQFANKGGFYLVPLSDKPSVHAEALSFANDRTDIGEPMRIIVGGGTGESIEKTITRATNLRDPRAAVFGMSGSRRMDNGQIKRLPAYLLAAQTGGLAAGLEIGEALTFKHFNITELDRIFEGPQLDMLNESGVIGLEYVRNRTNTFFRIVQDVTTYNDPTEPVRNEMGVGEANDFLVSELKIKLDNEYIGTKVVNSSASLIKNFVQSYLDEKKRRNEIQDYSPEEVQVILDGDVAMISMMIQPVRSLNKIVVNLRYEQKVLTA